VTSNRTTTKVGESRADKAFGDRRRRDTWFGLLHAAKMLTDASVEERPRMKKALKLYVDRLIALGVRPTPGEEP
jgi:hypothetical protein